MNKSNNNMSFNEYMQESLAISNGFNKINENEWKEMAASNALCLISIVSKHKENLDVNFI